MTTDCRARPHRQEAVIIRTIPRALTAAAISAALHIDAHAQEFALDPIWMSGGVGSSVGEYGVPESVEIDSFDRIVVTDKGRMMLHVYDSRTGAPLFDVGQIGSALGSFNRPNGVEVDAAGHILVVEQSNKRVQVLDRDYRPLRSWGGSSRFTKPMGIAIGPDGRIYVTDEGRADVQAFDANGNFLFRFDRTPLLDKVESIEVDVPGNRILVCDEGRSAVFIYDVQGNYLSQFGTQGSGPGQFGNDTNAVRLDSHRRIYVNDQGNSRINVFHSDTRFLASFRTTAGTFDSADGVLLSEAHNLFIVADQGNNRIVAFDLGEIQCRLGRIELEAASSEAAAGADLRGTFDAEPRSNPTPPWSGGTLYLEARLPQGRSSRVETVLAHVRSQRDPRGICVRMIETSAGSSVVRAEIALGESSNEATGHLATFDADDVQAHLAGETTELHFEFAASTAPSVLDLSVAGNNGAHATTVVGAHPHLTWQSSGASPPGPTHAELRLLNAHGVPLWSRTDIAGSTTSYLYDGPALELGHGYIFELRLATGRAWSPWKSLRVHRNNPPAMAHGMTPSAGTRLRSWPVTFTIPIPADADGDAVTGRIEWQLSERQIVQRGLVGLDGMWFDRPESAIDDNTALAWRVVVADEHDTVTSPWSHLVIDAFDEAPLPTQTRAPPAGESIHASRIGFAWDAAHDPDPNTHLVYTLEWSRSPAFTDPHAEPPTSHTRLDWTPPATDGPVYWRVLARDQTGRSSASSIARFELQRTARIVLRATTVRGIANVEVGTHPTASNGIASEDLMAPPAGTSPRLASRGGANVWLARDVRAPIGAGTEPLRFELRLTGAGTAPVRLRAESVLLPEGWEAAIRDPLGRMRSSWHTTGDLAVLSPDGAGNLSFELLLRVRHPRPVEPEVAEAHATADAPAGVEPAVRNSSSGGGTTIAGTRFQFGNGLGSTRLPIHVYDVRGRKVRQDRTASDGTWIWNGRDARGGRLPRGIYWVRAHGSGSGATRYRIVWAG